MRTITAVILTFVALGFTELTKPCFAGVPFAPTTAVVNIPFEGEPAKVTLELQRFPPPSALAKDGMSALRIEDWSTAIEKFKAAIAEKPGKWQYHLALAVACEAKGDYETAKVQYAEADRLHGNDGSIIAQNGLKRIKARGK